MAICKQEIEFMASAKTLFELSRRHETLFTIATLKLVIEFQGESISDSTYVLPLVWKRLVQYLRGADVCYASNGKLIVALSDIDSKEHARQFCERMISLLADEYHFEDKKYDVKIHLGLSLYPNDAENLAEMFAHAQEAAANIDSKINRIAFY